MHIIGSVEDLKALQGQDLGVSDWLSVGQGSIDAFAELTGDRQWIHTDVERAHRESPFGGPIAHGYLVLSLIPAMIGQICRFDGSLPVLNYGLDRVRFLTPVPAGSRLRARMRLTDEPMERNGMTRLGAQVRVEIEDRDMPACIADILFMVAR